MSKHIVKINEAYFADLGARYRTEFDKVNDAISYVNNTKELDSSLGLFKVFSKVVKNRQQSLDYDITCISSVFSATDAKMKERAEELIGAGIINGVAGGGEITVEYYDIKPDLKDPRELTHTQYGYTVDSEGNLVYDHPEETEKYLYRKQGSAYPNEYGGTCGLCTCANMLRLAGVNYDEKAMVDYAVANGLCRTGSTYGANGGTSPASRCKILNHFGLKSSLIDVEANSSGKVTQKTMDDIANYVSDGRGVNIAVKAGVLYNNSRITDTHSIVVTSVKKSADGKILGYFVCDSNENKPSYYSADVIQKALCVKPMVVTDSPIR